MLFPGAALRVGRGAVLRDQAFLCSWIQGVSFPCWAAVRPQHPYSWLLGLLTWGGGEVEVSAFRCRPYCSSWIFLACLATLEPLMVDLQSLLKGGGSWLPD